MTSPRGVVFDLDGTLVDSLHDIASATNHALGQHGRRALDSKTIAGFVGDGARALIARALGVAVDHESVDPVLETFLAHYAEHGADRTTLLPGAERVLAELDALELAVCTNKPRRITEIVLGKLGIEAFFREVVAGGDLERKKPDPEPVVHIASRLGLSPAELVMVGDGLQDIECGRSAGARTVAIRAGVFGDPLIEARPDAVIDELPELLAVLARWGADLSKAKRPGVRRPGSGTLR